MPSPELNDLIALIANGPVITDGTIAEQRASMAAMLEGLPLAEGVTVEEIRIGAFVREYIPA